jgi:hypothetical protein
MMNYGAREFLSPRARGTDTLVRREPRISAEIPSSDVQIGVRTPHAGWKRHAMCPTRQRPICKNDGESRRVAWSRVGRILLCKLSVIQITINWPVSASSILKDTAARFLQIVGTAPVFPVSRKPLFYFWLQPGVGVADVEDKRLAICVADVAPDRLAPSHPCAREQLREAASEWEVCRFHRSHQARL